MIFCLEILLRFRDDEYDRFWWPMNYADPRWANLSTASTIQPDPSFAEPSLVLQTAVAATGNDTALTYFGWGGPSEHKTAYSFMVFLHVADFQGAKLRQFDVYLNDAKLAGSPYTASFLNASCIYIPTAFRAAVDGAYNNITLVATAKSELPPMINALEIYSILPHSSQVTFSGDSKSSRSLALCTSSLTLLYKACLL